MKLTNREKYHLMEEKVSEMPIEPEMKLLMLLDFMEQENIVLDNLDD